MDGPRADRSSNYILGGIAARFAGSIGKYASLVGGICLAINGDIMGTALCGGGYAISDTIASFGDGLRNQGVIIEMDGELLDELKKDSKRPDRNP